MIVPTDEHELPEQFAVQFSFAQELVEAFNLTGHQVLDGQTTVGEFFATYREAKDEGIDSADLVRVIVMAG